MELIAYIVVLFMPPVSSDPYYLSVSEARFATLEACVAAVPDVIADEFAHPEHAFDGVACVSASVAASLQEARRRLYP